MVLYLNELEIETVSLDCFQNTTPHVFKLGPATVVSPVLLRLTRVAVPKSYAVGHIEHEPLLSPSGLAFQYSGADRIYDGGDHVEVLAAFKCSSEEFIMAQVRRVETARVDEDVVLLALLELRPSRGGSWTEDVRMMAADCGRSRLAKTWSPGI
ncbi:hypothetical protein COL5a_000330 [Colletotrichum fioriniae]|nr:hypothetical protein COL5a_000330 [Colletotrichum fioriniae]